VAGGFETADPADLAVMRRLLEINLLGVATTFQPFLQAMLDSQRPGALVGVASVAGWRGMPGNGAYCASKAGLIAYLQSLRAELRPTRLTVHTISPGYLRTALTASNTFAMPGLLGPDEAARDLLRGVAQGREHIVLPRRIGWLSQALSLLPARWHDRILLGQPRKPRAHQAGATPIPGLSHQHDKT
jgi:NAD(P)-dependent dehydrogenase (short-subunit alcohol dehydrogenase family)